jgi:hypothetical protein
LTGDDVFKVFAAGHNGAPVSSADSYSNSPPLFVSPPPGGSFYLNQPISLVAEASGFGMLTYQWWKDGSPLAGGDSPVYSHAANSDAVGQYSVVVTDGYGRSATSAPAAVTIISPSLSIASLAGGVKLSWPGAATSYHLESAPEPSGPWTVVASSQTNSIVIPATNSASFYRLHVN